MALETKICGINSEAAMDAAIAGGAALVGLVFFARSARNLSLDRAAALAARVPAGVRRVGLVVDEPDERLDEIMRAVPLDMLQLHGAETPERVSAVRARYGKPVMKAIPVATREDLALAERYVAVADRLLFDAKPPAAMAEALPGGNALSFDWDLLGGRNWAKPWMLAGGLNAGNLADAVARSGARRVDVSSGVEDRPGVKSPAKIEALLRLAATL
ncbi:MAG: phosphoribosylanthranilate isomerase [Dongiaceae bacterium]